jgi:hypothetical protein
MSIQKAYVFLGFQAAHRSSSHVYTQLLVQQLIGSWDRLSVVHDNSASRLARFAWKSGLYEDSRLCDCLIFVQRIRRGEGSA